MLHIEERTGRRVLTYRHGQPEAGKQYPLTSFIHPLIGLDGETLTAVRPADHIHHRGVYWSWVRHELNGQSLGDWWQPRNIHLEPLGIKPVNGPVYAGFVARFNWVHQSEDTATPKSFMREQVMCRVFPSTDVGQAIDIDLTLTALIDGVSIGGTLAKDKGYGGFTVRFNQASNVQIEADGNPVTEANLNHLRAHWTDWTGHFMLPSGKRNSHRSGAAIFVHNAHPDAPPEWITRTYGPMNVAYPGLEMLSIPKEKPLRLRYRLWIHRGDADAGQVENYYYAYVADWR